MKKPLFLILALLVFNHCFSQTFDWFSAGGSNSSSQGRTNYGVSAYDTWGGIIAVTNFSAPGNIDSFSVSGGTYIIRYNRHGQAVWVKKIVSGPAIDVIKIDNSGDIAIGGGLNNQVYIAKFSSNGNLLWELIGSGSAYQPMTTGLDFDQSGNVFAVGTFGDNLTLGGKFLNGFGCNANPFIAKISSSGSVRWINTTDNGYCGEADKIVYVKNMNRIIVVGKFFTYFSFQNQTITLPAGSTANFYMMSLDTNGVLKNLKWNSQHSSYGDKIGNMVVDNDSHIYLSGYVDETLNFNSFGVPVYNKVYYIMKVDTGLNPFWIKASKSTYTSNTAYPLIAIERNKIIMVGAAGSIIFGTDTVQKDPYKTNLFCAIFDTSGKYISSKSIVADKYSVMSVSSDQNGSVIVSGYYDQNDNWGGKPLPSILENYYVGNIKIPQFLVSGNVFYDNNGNGLKDGADWLIPSVPVYDSIQGNIVFSKINGSYNLLMDSGKHLVKIAPLPYTEYSLPLPSNSYLFNYSSNVFYYPNKDFGLKPVPNISDLYADVTVLNAFRPGFSSLVKIIAGNKGTNTINSTLKFVIPSFTTINYISIPASTQNGDTLTWVFANFKPFEKKDIVISLKTDVGTVINSSENSHLSIFPLLGDTTPIDNIDSIRIKVTGSFDPNVKEVSPLGDISTEFLSKDSLLHYTIKFQNTGNDTAHFVALLDTIDVSKLDIKTIHLINYSHPCTMRLLNNKVVEFTFEKIYLPDSNTNELASHGFVKFSIKPKKSLAVNDLIINNAAIFFDYNAPVVTNKTSTKIINFISGIIEQKQDNTLILFPNPTTLYSQLNVFTDTEMDVEMYISDNSGRIVSTSSLKLQKGRNAFNINTSEWAKGVYCVALTSKTNHWSGKLIKQ